MGCVWLSISHYKASGMYFSVLASKKWLRLTESGYIISSHFILPNGSSQLRISTGYKINILFFVFVFLIVFFIVGFLVLYACLSMIIGLRRPQACW